MSKIIILTDRIEIIPKTILESEKYKVCDKIDECGCDVISIHGISNVSHADIDKIADALSCKSVIVGYKPTVSRLKKLIYKFFGEEKGAGNCGIIGIPADYVKDVSPKTKKRTVKMISEAEKSNIPLGKADLYNTAVRFGMFNFIADLYELFFMSTPLKYLFSSVAAFLIDYFILITLNKIILESDSLSINAGAMEISALAAWCISSFTNFTLNKKFVFNSNAPYIASLAEYYGLASAVFFLKTYILLEILTRLLKIKLGIAKLIAEALFFILNYFIQKKLIFKRRASKKD